MRYRLSIAVPTHGALSHMSRISSTIRTGFNWLILGCPGIQARCILVKVSERYACRDRFRFRTFISLQWLHKDFRTYINTHVTCPLFVA